MTAPSIITALTDDCTKSVFYELYATKRRYTVPDLLRCSKIAKYNKDQVRNALIKLMKLRAVTKCELTRKVDGRNRAAYVAQH